MSDPSLLDSLRGKRVGLCLSAGFFGFFGHAGFLDGLLEAGLTFTSVAGSSAGALVGGLHAAGVPNSRAIELLGQLKREAFWDPDPLAIAKGLLGRGDGASGLLEGEKFRALLRGAVELKRIEECSIPLRIAVTSLTHGRLEHLAVGRLDEAIHASCAYPGLFRAARMHDAQLWDGGLIDKAPLLPLLASDMPALDAVLVHWLPSRFKSAPSGPLAYAQGLDAAMAIARHDHFRLQLELARARGATVHVVSSDLPALSPTKLHLAADVISKGRESARAALAARPPAFSLPG